jgi:hypothetical protein
MSLSDFARKVVQNVADSEANRIAGDADYAEDHKRQAHIAYDQACQVAGRRLSVAEVIRLSKS